MIEVRYKVTEVEYKKRFKQGTMVGLVQEGRAIKVYYLDGDPSISSISPPRDLLAEEAPALLLGAFLFATFLAAAISSLPNTNTLLQKLFLQLVSPRLFSMGVTAGVVLTLVMLIGSRTLSAAHFHYCPR